MSKDRTEGEVQIGAPSVSRTATNAVLAKASWIADFCERNLIKPYVFVRTENRVTQPGSRLSIDWFPFSPIYKDPLFLSSLPFAERILHLESQAFGGAGLAMPRWVFYDCAVVPGFVAGFAMHRSVLPESYVQLFRICPYPGGLSVGPGSADFKDEDWFPISLFIIIPTMHEGEWVAHNLCAINSVVPEKDRLYGLGFITKAFGLWYANVETCCGMTQWGSPALKLHSHYGFLKILTAYTPTHTHANTMTYHCVIDPSVWPLFFTRKEDHRFGKLFKPTVWVIDPKSEASQRELQKRIECGEGPFFLSPEEIGKLTPRDPLTLFTKS
jgi:hypothetical protein